MHRFSVVSLLIVAFLGYIAYSTARKAEDHTLSAARAYKLVSEIELWVKHYRTFPPRVTTIGSRHLSWNAILAANDYTQSDLSRIPRNMDSNELLKLGSARYVIEEDGQTLSDMIAVNEDDAILESATPTKVEDVIDGLSNTLLFCQIQTPFRTASDVNNIALNDFLNSCRDSKTSAIARCSGFRNQLLVFADGTIAELTHSLPEDTWRALWTKSGREDIHRDDLIVRGGLKIRVPGSIH